MIGSWVKFYKKVNIFLVNTNVVVVVVVVVVVAVVVIMIMIQSSALPSVWPCFL